MVLSLSAITVTLPGLRTPLINALADTLMYRSQALALNTIATDATQSREDLLERVRELEKENRELIYENVSLETVKMQNAALKEQFDREEEQDTDNMILGRVLSRPPFSPYDTLIVDVGERNGIEAGMKVLASESTEIGTVTEVNATTAHVELYSSAGVRTPVEINGDGALYVAEGQGGGKISAHIPRRVDVKNDDLLTVPSFNSRVIATVQETNTPETEPFTRAVGNLPINLFELTWVLIER